MRWSGVLAEASRKRKWIEKKTRVLRKTQVFRSRTKKKNRVMDWAKTQGAGTGDKFSPSSGKQMNILEAMFPSSGRFDASVPNIRDVRNITVNRGIERSKRKKISYRLRDLLDAHFQTSYRGTCVSDVRDNPEGGFIIEKRDGYLVEETIVGGISNAIERYLTSAEGDMAVSTFYSTSVPSGVSNGTVPTKKRSAAESGLRLHQLFFHKIECERESQESRSARMQTCKRMGREMSLTLSTSTDSLCCPCDALMRGDRWTEAEEKKVEFATKYIEEKLDLIPVASEMFLWHPEKKIGTRIDLLCIDSALRYVVISIKTGKFGRHPHFGETSAFFRSPFQRVKDSIKYRHDMQLLMEILFLTEVYQMDISDAFILYLHSDGARPLSIRRPEGMATELGVSAAGLINLVSIGLCKNTPMNK